MIQPQTRIPCENDIQRQVREQTQTVQRTKGIQPTVVGDATDDLYKATKAVYDQQPDYPGFIHNGNARMYTTAAHNLPKIKDQMELCRGDFKKYTSQQAMKVAYFLSELTIGDSASLVYKQEDRNAKIEGNKLPRCYSTGAVVAMKLDNRPHVPNETNGTNYLYVHTQANIGYATVDQTHLDDNKGYSWSTHLLDSIRIYKNHAIRTRMGMSNCMNDPRRTRHAGKRARTKEQSKSRRSGIRHFICHRISSHTDEILGPNFRRIPRIPYVIPRGKSSNLVSTRSSWT